MYHVPVYAVCLHLTRTGLRKVLRHTNRFLVGACGPVGSIMEEALIR